MSIDHQRKADQHWEMAGLARQDNDMEDADRHTKKAREHQALAAGEVVEDHNET